MNATPSLLWLRNDLRLHDHPALNAAIRHGSFVLPVFVFDERWLSENPYGFLRMGPFRYRFLKESVMTLQQNMRHKNSDLLILHGNPAEQLTLLAKAIETKNIFHHTEFSTEELTDEDVLMDALEPLGVEFHDYDANFLYEPDDLPLNIEQLPELFTNFRKIVEKKCRIHPPLDMPDRLPRLPFQTSLSEFSVMLQEIAPGLQFGFPDYPEELPKPDSRAVLSFQGGEEAGLARLRHYVWESRAIAEYKETRNGLLGADYSGKFSPWLANGCLSPRQIAYEVHRFEREVKKNDSTYWMIFELIWRDYWRFAFMKHGSRYFFPQGIHGDLPLQKFNAKWFASWKKGELKEPFVDANMRELLLTGFMSNRGRQNVASYWAKTMNLDWRAGAYWFEHQLIDYDVYSNWGNWAYVAGVGNDARDRVFNVKLQADRYDPKGEYVKTWMG